MRIRTIAIFAPITYLYFTTLYTVQSKELIKSTIKIDVQIINYNKYQVEISKFMHLYHQSLNQYFM